MKKDLTLREIQLEELKILICTAEIIEKNNLKYTLAGGTLLGAVRHKGFIPWDDDIDILIPRPDYEKFIRIFDKENKIENYELECFEKRNTFVPYSKIINKKIEIMDNSVCDQEKRFLWIDVMPMDGLPDDERTLEKRYRKIKILDRLLYINHYNVLDDPYSSVLKKALKLEIKPFTKRITAERIINIAKECDFDSSKYVGSYVWGYGPQEKILKSDLDYIDVEFENHTFKGLKCYDSYLKGLYHDYMTLPPEDKRVTHNIKAWRTDL